jgi:hypothetical protein
MTTSAGKSLKGIHMENVKISSKITNLKLFISGY